MPKWKGSGAEGKFSRVGGAQGDEDGYVMQRSRCPEKKSESAVSLLEDGSLRTDLRDVMEGLCGED